MAKTPFQSRIVGEGGENPTQLLANPLNWRRHPKHQQDALEGMLRTVGWVQRVIVNKRTGHVVDGHLRVEVALRRNEPTVPVLYVDLTEEEEKVVLAAIDPIGGLAETDQDMLDDLLEGVETGDAELDAFLDSLRSESIEVLEEGLTDEDAVPDVPVQPVTVLGDVWVLGKHRLMCGDSTSVDAVDKLMDGGKADMVYCDPPYGMALDTDYSKIKGSAKSPNAKGYKWDKVIGDDQDFDPSQLIDIFQDAREQFWWGADYYFECLPRGGSLLVWQKRDKADAAMIGNDFEICWSNQRHKKATFWKRWVGFDSIERGEKRVHPTQKPVDLHCWVFEQWGKPADTVVDLFGGSGSTLIACEKTGRTARLMELDPKYCDVIVKRWQDFTGKQATLESTGKTFADVDAQREAEPQEA